MPRILLASPYFAPKIGGVERYAHRLAVGLRDGHGHDVTVLTTGREGPADRIGIDGLRVVEVPARWALSATPFDPGWFRDVRRVIRSVGPDVLITHAPVPGLADVCLAVRGAVPAVATYHSGSMKKGRPVLDAGIAAYETAVLPRLLRGADAVVTTYPAGGPGATGAVHVPPGVDTGVFHPSDPPGRHPHLVLYAGRIEHASAWKGIGTLLHACALLASAHPDLRLELAGGGDALDHYRARADDLGLGGRVRFRGALGADELADAYRRAALVVLPSETDAEAFGMVLIEAMACGTPVVAARAGGMPAVVADTGGGVLAEPGDARSLADAIGSLLADPARARALGAAGRTRVVQRYSWTRVAAAYDELIHDLLKPEGGHLARSS